MEFQGLPASCGRLVQRVTHLNSTSRKYEPADVAENSISMFSEPSNFPEINKQVGIMSVCGVAGGNGQEVERSEKNREHGSEIAPWQLTDPLLDMHGSASPKPDKGKP